MSIDFFALAWKINFPGKPLKKLVLLSLADHYNNNVGFAWPSYETIATRCGVDRRTVIRVVAELESDGFITREKRHKIGRMRTSNAYRLNEKLMRSAAGLTEVPQNTKRPPPGMVTQDHHSSESPPSALSMVTDDHHYDSDTGSPSIVKHDHHDGDTGSPSVVTDDHHDGDRGSPSIVTEDHHDGDRRSPELLNEPLSEPVNEPLSTTATVPAGLNLPSDAAVADAKSGEALPPDPLAPILDWIGFDDALTADERAALDPAFLLAWSYWVQLERTKQGSRVNNPVGLIRARWRRGQLPREDLMALARGWLSLDDEGRGRLLQRLEDSRLLGGLDPDECIDEPFGHIPPATAWAVYKAAGGMLAPPALSPAIPPRAIEQPSPPTDAFDSGTKASSTLWKEALEELELQMTRATFATWLRGTTAAENGNGLTVFVRNSFALEWLENRLRPLIQRTVDALAGQSMPVHFTLNGDGHEAV